MTPAAVSIAIPGNPLSQNRVYRIVIIGKGKKQHATLAMTPEGKDFKAKIAFALLRARPAAWNIDGNATVEACYWYDSERPDVDGPGKLVLDAIQGVLVANDRRFTDFIQRRRIDRARPRLELTVRGSLAPKSAEQVALPIRLPVTTL